MYINTKDQEILKELGRRVAEIAALPVQQETIKLWKALNGLKPIRGMVMIDQIPWHEMNVDGELKLQTEDAFCRGIETQLRRILYSWKHMRADMVVQPFVTIHKAIGGTGFGGFGSTEIRRSILSPSCPKHSSKGFFVASIH